MADSAFLSRLPVRGAVATSAGSSDAFKVPLLNAEGKIDPSLIDNKVIYEVQNEAARVALPNVVVGDIVLQLNTKAIYVLTTLPSSVDGNWQSLGTGIVYPVTSVSGKTGDVVLGTSDIVSLDEALSARVLSTDSRLSDSRAPLAHKSSHSSGGSDAITPSDIGAAPVSHSHTKSQITDFPTLGSASSLDAPFTGDALASQVVLGSDSRLVGNVKTSSVGLAGGVPSLDNTGKVPLEQLPTGIGTAGASVNLQVANGYIQWQHVGDNTWTNLIAISSLAGPAGSPGASVNLQVANGYIQWQHVGDNTWTNLIAISSLAGPAGSPGSDASVTKANITTALGYLPVSPDDAIAYAVSL